VLHVPVLWQFSTCESTLLVTVSLVLAYH
jgi:hypothetical protein